MTLEQLEFIVAVKRCGTITAAAQHLNISHPAISRAISGLEHELGVNIFIRTRAGTTVTEEGEQIIESAQRILNEVSYLKDMAKHPPEQQAIAVAAFPVDSMSFLPELILSFRRQCGYVVVNLIQESLSGIITKIKTQQLDFGIAAIPMSQKKILSDGVTGTLLFESDLSIAVGPIETLRARPFLTPEEVLQYPLILHDDAIISSALEDIFGVQTMPNVLMYSNDNALIKQMVAGGQALSVYTSFLAQSDSKVASGEIKLVPLRGGTSGDAAHLKIGYMLLHNKKKRLSQADRLFIKILNDTTAEWKASC